ncbi:unnamed protein product [Haemonchus placei]|uniref:Helicase ATP-binding domain-containing protein n=1 Tax=Haemonchus placei TaxID=6290 RepID=A0A0N4WXV0_HAEPC|nr:unnamed protein product [Haemonchus placei]
MKVRMAFGDGRRRAVVGTTGVNPLNGKAGSRIESIVIIIDEWTELKHHYGEGDEGRDVGELFFVFKRLDDCNMQGDE